MTAPPDEVIRAAVAQAKMSPCGKSKRGVVLYARGDGRATIAGRGFNGLPGGLLCSVTCVARRNTGVGTDYTDAVVSPGAIAACEDACSWRCVHAEKRAIRAAINAGYAVRVFTAVHVKVDAGGNLVSGGGPSCWQCAKEVLDVNLDGFWLYESIPVVTDVPVGLYLPEGAILLQDTPVCASVWRHYTAKEFYDASMRAAGLQEGFCT